MKTDVEHIKAVVNTYLPSIFCSNLHQIKLNINNNITTMTDNIRVPTQTKALKWNRNLTIIVTISCIFIINLEVFIKILNTSRNINSITYVY